MVPAQHTWFWAAWFILLGAEKLITQLLFMMSPPKL